MAHIFIEPMPEIPPSLEVAQSDLYSLVDKNLDIKTRSQIVYDRARAVSRAYGTSILS